MMKAIAIDITNREAFWQDDEQDDTKVAALVANATTFSREVWARPGASVQDAKKRAEVCAYWTGGHRNENGELELPDLASDNFGRRSVAELIAAVLALDN